MSRLFYSLLFYCLTGVGASLAINSYIGVSSFDSMNMSLANILSMKIGTITILSNFLFIFLDIIITKFSNPIKYLLQVISVLCLGFVINIVTYYVFSKIKLDSYELKLIVFIIGTLIAAISIGAVISFETLSFPVENFCITLSEKTKISFTKLRYSIDIISFITSIILSYLFELPFFIREGTLIGMLIFSPTVNKSRLLWNKKST